MAITRQQLNSFLNELLMPERWQDYGPNGLQIQGTDTIKKIGFSVSATRHSIEATCQLNAHALIVHHGLFWNFHGVKPITDAFAARVIPLIKNDINLFAYHLPLDAHLNIGNAAGVAKMLGLVDIEPFGDYKGATLGVKGQFSTPMTAIVIKEKLSHTLKRSVTLASPDLNATIKSIGIITGGAGKYWTESKRQNLDAFLTGEISEHDWHEAPESGIHFFAAGHHATERFGVMALMELIQKKFQLECHYIESDNEA